MAEMAGRVAQTNPVFTVSTVYQGWRLLFIVHRLDLYVQNCVPSVGLEPTIPGLGDRCLIHWATRAVA